MFRDMASPVSGLFCLHFSLFFILHITWDTEISGICYEQNVFMSCWYFLNPFKGRGSLIVRLLFYAILCSCFT